MSQQQAIAKLELTSLLDKLRTELLARHSVSVPVTMALYIEFRNEKARIKRLVRDIRHHPEFKNVSEPGKSHGDLLVKGAMLRNSPIGWGMNGMKMEPIGYIMDCTTRMVWMHRRW